MINEGSPGKCKALLQWCCPSRLELPMEEEEWSVLFAAFTLFTSSDGKAAWTVSLKAVYDVPLGDY